MALASWMQTASSTPNNFYEFNDMSYPILVNQNMDFFSLTANAQSLDLTLAQGTQFFFKQEEIMFGRDITIDSLFVSISGSAGQRVVFLVWENGTDQVLSSALILPSTASPTQYYSYQIFFTEQIKTVRSPQLSVVIDANSSGIYNYVRFGKVAMFSSFDPNQRPT